MTGTHDLAPATADTAPAMAALYARAFDAPWETQWSADAIRDLLALPTVAAMILGSEPALSGMVMVQAAAGEAEILTIAVDPACRGRGLGRRLLDGAAIWAAARGADRLLLEVAVDNMPARTLYLSAGFRIAGRRRGYYARGKAPAVDAEVMELPLVPA